MRYTHKNTAAIGCPMDVFLDGVQVDDVTEADTAEGYVIQCKRDGDGHFIIDGDGKVMTTRLNGAVKVVPKVD